MGFVQNRPISITWKEFSQNTKPFERKSWFSETNFSINCGWPFSEFVLVLMGSCYSSNEPLLLEIGGQPELHCNHHINTSLVLKKRGRKLFVKLCFNLIKSLCFSYKWVISCTVGDWFELDTTPNCWEGPINNQRFFIVYISLFLFYRSVVFTFSI